MSLLWLAIWGCVLLLSRFPLLRFAEADPPLASSRQSFKEIVLAPSEKLGGLGGLGDTKVKRLRDTFEGTFVVGKKKKQKSQAEKNGEKGAALN